MVVSEAYLKLEPDRAKYQGSFPAPAVKYCRQSCAIVLLCFALIVVTLAVYWQVGNHEFLNYDDGPYITENPHTSTGLTGSNVFWAFTSTHSSNWHPITWLSHMADAQMYGMNPRGHHLTNVIIHTVTAVLLLLLLFRLTGSLWQSSFVAAMFALHPLHVESVAWAAERKDILCAFFWFLTLLFYAEYVKKRKPTQYLLSLLSFVLGLMSKPMLVTLPIVMLLLDFWPFDRYPLVGQKALRHRQFGLMFRLTPLVKEKIPFFACSLLSAAVTIYAQHEGGAMRSLIATPFRIRVENAISAYVKYITKTLWPQDLAVFYPYPSSVPLWQVICSLLVLVFISATTISVRRRHPSLVVGWFWFIVTLVPVIGLIQVGDQAMADRYSYIPLTGLFIMAAWGFPIFTKVLPQYLHGIVALTACLVITVSTVLTCQQLGYWQDNVSLFRHAAHVTPGNYLAHFNLGSIYTQKNDLDDAIKEYRKALETRPYDIKAHTNLGSVLAKKRAFDAAIREYQEVLMIDPNDIMAHINIGNALAEKGDFNAAIKVYNETIMIDPNNIGARLNLAAVLANYGYLDTAIKEYNEALKLNPNSVEIQNNLNKCLVKNGGTPRGKLISQKASRQQ